MAILSVREIATKDIERIANYWHQSDPLFMQGMGVDLSKLPSKESFTQMLSAQINCPIEQKASYALIWEADGMPVGHSNVNKIKFGEEAYMHLHLWYVDSRKKGIGTELVKQSLRFYFENLKLHTLFCEPYALNPAPNKTLEKVGFEFQRSYVTVPGSINFEQEVNLWKLSRKKYTSLIEQQ